MMIRICDHHNNFIEEMFKTFFSCGYIKREFITHA